MVGGDAVSQDSQYASSADVANRGRLNLHVVEIRSAANVGGIFFPGVGLAFGNVEAAPALVSGKNFGVTFRKHFGRDRVLDCFFDFALRGPDISEIDRLTVFAFAEGVFAQVGVDASGKREGDNE